MDFRLRSITLLALLTPLLCLPAMGGESDSVEFTIQGVAPPVCKLPEIAASDAVNASMSGGTITVAELIDTTNATVKPWSIKVISAGAMCNYNAYIHIESVMGGLRPTEATDHMVSGEGTFLDRVDYQVTATWGNVAINPMDTASGVYIISQQSGGPNIGDLVIELKSNGSSVPVVQGQFLDRIKIHVGAQL
jgi:hypothetical protein